MANDYLNRRYLFCCLFINEMKKLILLFVLAGGLANAQSPIDTIARERITKLENELKEIRLNLTDGRREHNVGVMLMLSGIAGVGTSFLIKDSNTSVPILIGGGVLNLFGFCVTIDAHKWIWENGY